MKACVLEGIGQLKYKDVEIPVMKKGEVLVNVKACGICSSDIPRIFTTGTYHFPTIPGHEFCGQIVDAAEDVDKSYIGKRAVIFPLIPCGECPSCKEKEYARCDNYNYFGSRCDGGMAEYISVPLWNIVTFSDDIPWTMVPERKITVEDVKYALSTHFQNTPYDPYITRGDLSNKGALRPVGINRNDFLSVLQVRQGQEPIEWFTFGSNVFNTLVPLYIHIDTVPEYYSNTTAEVSTDNFYWANRLIGAMADACDKQSAIHIERYQRVVQSHSHHIIHTYDELIEKETDEARKTELRHEANQKAADMLKKETSKNSTQLTGFTLGSLTSSSLSFQQ